MKNSRFHPFVMAGFTIVNQNDTVSVEEIKLGNNENRDNLALID